MRPVFKRLPSFVAAAGLALALATSALAQTGKQGDPGFFGIKTVKAAPIAFHNQTNMTLTLEGVSYVDSLGNLKAFRKGLAWSFKPGDNLWLQDNGNKIYATKFTGKVYASGKTSEWVWNSNGPDANGYFVTAFTADNLRYHLGEKAVVVVKPPQGGPTQQQQQNGVAKIIVAVIAHAAAEEIIKKKGNNANFLEIAAVLTAREVRNAAVRSALTDLFPRLTVRQSSDAQRLISDAIDGRLNFAEGQQAAKQRLINDMRAANADLADAAVLAEFIYAIYQASRKR